MRSRLMRAWMAKALRSSARGDSAKRRSPSSASASAEPGSGCSWSCSLAISEGSSRSAGFALVATCLPLPAQEATSSIKGSHRTIVAPAKVENGFVETSTTLVVGVASVGVGPRFYVGLAVRPAKGRAGVGEGPSLNASVARGEEVVDELAIGDLAKS